MIDKIKISDSVPYKERVDLIIEKINEMIEVSNFLEKKVIDSVADLNLDISLLKREVKNIESNTSLLLNNAKNKSMNQDIFIKSILEKIEMLKNMINNGDASLISLHLSTIEQIEKEINETNKATTTQLNTLNDIYSYVKTRI